MTDLQKHDIDTAWLEWIGSREGSAALDQAALVEQWTRFAPGSDEALMKRLHTAFDAGAKALFDSFLKELLGDAELKGLVS